MQQKGILGHPSADQMLLQALSFVHVRNDVSGAQPKSREDKLSLPELTDIVPINNKMAASMNNRSGNKVT